MTNYEDALYSKDFTVLFADCSESSLFYSDQLELIKEYTETSVNLYNFTENIQVTQKVDADGQVIWEHVTAHITNRETDTTIPILGKLRNCSAYESDQLEVISEVTDLSLYQFTDHIYVIQEFSDQGIFEQEIFMPFEEKENREYLVSLFEQIAGMKSRLLKFAKLSAEFNQR
ncbi:hypothetical protein [Vagococcus fluvialis]|uniref:hypothetical protein n=1 Tax=Vagococcus fluvialis TaxID=2738 RepID=UPI003B227902